MNSHDLPPTKLIGLHIFVRNDVSSGIGIGLDDQFFSDNPTIAQHLIECSQCSIKEYKTLKTSKERAVFIQDTVNQMEQMITYLKSSTTMDTVFFQHFSILLDDVSFLVETGFLPDDEFNGIQWCYIGN